MSRSASPLPCRSELSLASRADWPERPFPIPGADRQGGVPTVVRQSVLQAIHRHGLETTEVEVCGILVGDGYRDPEGVYVYVEGAIRGAHAASQPAQVTFTADTWDHVHEQLERDWPGRRVLGWYHTHPGFGIFLSNMDLFIHETFFAAPEQIAYVYDPVGGDEGLFVWRAGKPERAAAMVELDVAPELAEPHGPAQTPMPIHIAGDEVDDLAAAVEPRRPPRRLAVAIALTALVAAGIAAWKARDTGRSRDEPAGPGTADRASETGVTASDEQDATATSPPVESERETPRIDDRSNEPILHTDEPKLLQESPSEAPASTKPDTASIEPPETQEPASSGNAVGPMDDASRLPTPGGSADG